MSVACALNLSGANLEDDVDPTDSVSKVSRSTIKSSSTTASSARLKATARKAVLMARAQVLNDGLEMKRRQLQLQHDQEQLKLKAEISEVEAEERVYRMFEEKRELSEHSAVEGSTRKLNPNATDWPYGYMFGGEK